MATHKSNHTTFLTIEKRNDAEQIVEGYASSENIDQQPGMWDGVAYEGDVVSAEAIRKALPEYMEWANVHEMHNDSSAVGTILKAEVISGEVILSDGKKLLNPLHVIAKIVDPLAWEKVVTGVYKGFSIQANVFKLKLQKIAGHVVRVIQSLQLTEISLVDRPANPGARILLWKGSNMAKQIVVSKSGDPMKAVEMLQELRNECELAGDLAGAGNYTNAIALIMQGQGAEVEVVAEDDEEASEEHAELGKPAPGEGEDAEAVPDDAEKEEPSAEEMDKALNEEQPEAAAEEAPEGKDADAAKKDEEPVKKAARSHKASHGSAVEVISKAEFVTLTGRVDEISKAFAGDIARLAKGLEDLSEMVDGLQNRPVLHELPANGNTDQPVQILKGMLDELTDPGAREILGLKIAEMEIRGIKPNYVGYSR